MTQDQFNIVKAIDQKCGGRVLKYLGSSEPTSLSVAEDAIAFRMIVAVALRAGRIELLHNQWATGTLFSASSWINTAQGIPTAFDAVLALAAKVFGVESPPPFRETVADADKPKIGEQP